MNRAHLLLFAALGLVACSDDDPPPADNACNLAYNLPADIPVGVSAADQTTFDTYSWQTFLALNAPSVGGQVTADADNSTQWAAWSSSVDFIECNAGDDSRCNCTGAACRRSGARYYPAECEAVPGYMSLRVLGEIDKADDGFLEAKTNGLSNEPVIDANGEFLRYEILVSPSTYDWMATNALYDFDTIRKQACDGSGPVAFPCGASRYTGGDPANPQMGGLVLKVAWMASPLAGVAYHQEDLLVYTPAYRNASGVATCEKKTMNMVGMHVIHKTVQQPNWTWSTFEHVQNAPDCAGEPPAPRPNDDPGPNRTPPAAAPTADYNFRSMSECGAGNCAEYNEVPTSNDPTGTCKPPGDPTATAWCLDQPPVERSQLCVQAPIATNYPEAAALNAACRTALGCGEGTSATAPWCNYQLVSTQWVSAIQDAASCTTLDSTKEMVLPAITNQAPKVALSGGGTTRPFLGNTSMESYERPNCNRCHGKSLYKITDSSAGDMEKSVFTDYVYHLTLEACQMHCNNNGLTPCPCMPAIGTGTVAESVDCSAL